MENDDSGRTASGPAQVSLEPACNSLFGLFGEEARRICSFLSEVNFNFCVLSVPRQRLSVFVGRQPLVMDVGPFFNRRPAPALARPVSAEHLRGNNLPNFYFWFTNMLWNTSLYFALDIAGYAPDSFDVTQIRYEKTARRNNPDAFVLRHGGHDRNSWAFTFLSAAVPRGPPVLVESHEWGTGAVPPREIRFYNLGADAFAERIVAAGFLSMRFDFVPDATPDIPHSLFLREITFGSNVTPMRNEFLNLETKHWPVRQHAWAIQRVVRDVVGRANARAEARRTRADFTFFVDNLPRQQLQIAVPGRRPLALNIPEFASRRVPSVLAMPLTGGLIDANLLGFYDTYIDFLWRASRFIAQRAGYQDDTYDSVSVMLERRDRGLRIQFQADGWDCVYMNGRGADLVETLRLGDPPVPLRFYNLGCRQFAREISAGGPCRFFAGIVPDETPGMRHRIHLRCITFGVEATLVLQPERASQMARTILDRAYEGAIAEAIRPRVQFVFSVERIPAQRLQVTSSPGRRAASVTMPGFYSRRVPSALAMPLSAELVGANLPSFYGAFVSFMWTTAAHLARCANYQQGTFVPTAAGIARRDGGFGALYEVDGWSFVHGEARDLVETLQMDQEVLRFYNLDALRFAGEIAAAGPCRFQTVIRTSTDDRRRLLLEDVTFTVEMTELAE